ncbi:hypothetical protein [Streptomyces sp. NPDC048361]|uniref:hypothetical protein n=1 Tax=Streptomyces sp. NPDC048361 TaxID=3154720 RepID=UPI00344075D6
MSEPQPPLGELLARLDALIAQTGLDRDEVLNLEQLSSQTALRPDEIETLLAGRAMPEESVRHRINRRITRLFESLLTETGKRAVDLRADIAAEVGVSPEWVRRWLRSGPDVRLTVPNLENVVPLQKFFGVGEGFFTSPDADLLGRALWRLLQDLESTADPMSQVLEQLGLSGIATRTKPLSEEKKKTLAKTIRLVMALEEEEEE